MKYFVLIIVTTMAAYAGESAAKTVPAQEVDPGQALEIPGYFNRPIFRWEDLDGDGVLDIWVSDSDYQVWVCDGRGSVFEKLEFENMDMPIKPVKTQEGWRIQAWHNGQILEHHPENGWFVAQDFNDFSRVRPGMRPIDGEKPLIPTYDGYWMMDGPCEQVFKVMPAVELDKYRMKLTYARPQWTDINGDGQLDLLAKPLLFEQHSQVRIWSALREGDAWRSQWSSLDFPKELKISDSKSGDLNGDGIDDLVILGQPANEMSFFDELSFVVYLGEGPGQWSATPIQVLKTKQNLWQTGPIEVNERGILLYYYKGIIRSHFRMDRYRWNKAGFIEPKPETGKWTLKDADRDFINLDFDINNDGLKDMILQDEEAVRAYFRADEDIPFEENRMKELSPSSSGERSFTITIGEDEVSATGNMSLRLNQARGHNSLALVNKGKQASIWRLSRKVHGHWKLTRIL